MRKLEDRNIEYYLTKIDNFIHPVHQGLCVILTIVIVYFIIILDK